MSGAGRPSRHLHRVVPWVITRDKVTVARAASEEVATAIVARMGKGWATHKAADNNARACVINKVPYPSQAAAARANGVTVSAVRDALRYGYQDRVGIRKRKEAAMIPDETVGKS
jgi:hypothetical protein